jgi:putative transport protein
MEAMMIQWFAQALEEHNGLLLFVILGLGYLLGRVEVKGFSLGPVAGVLFVGIFFGHYGYRFGPSAQAVGFALFIFAVGYQAGPGFVMALRRDGLKYLALSFLVAGGGLVTAVALARMLGLETGMAAGLLAGGLTSSPTLAAAQEAVRTGGVSLPPGLDADTVVANISTTYAITYIFGLTGLIILIKLIPKLFGVDYPTETMKLQASLGMESAGGSPVSVRTYRVTNPEMTRVPVGELRRQYWDGRTVFRLYRNGARVRLGDDEKMELGDVVVIIGPVDYIIALGKKLGEETEPPESSLSDLNLETARIVVTRKAWRKNRPKVDAIALEYGLVVLNILRQGTVLPAKGNMRILPSDVLTVMGPAKEIEAAGIHLGYLEREAVETDMVSFAFGIAAGILIGMLSVEIGGLSIGLGAAGGLLVSGILIGYRRSVRPTFGRLPEPTRWFLMEFGLLIFMAGVGLRAGGTFVQTLMDSGAVLIVAGVVVTLVPVLLGYTVGRYLLKLNPVLLLGALTGAMTSGASLSIVLKEADSPLPALGYTGTYAFSNILLVFAGSLVFLFG